MKRNNIKEKVIRYLLSEKREYNNNKLSVDIGRDSFANSKIFNIGEDEFIKQISELETDGLIEVKFNAGHRDLKYGVSVVLHSGIINYFDDKKERNKNKRDEWIKFWIPVSISIIALLKSFSSEIIALWEVILKLLGQ